MAAKDATAILSAIYGIVEIILNNQNQISLIEPSVNLNYLPYYFNFKN